MRAFHSPLILILTLPLFLTALATGCGGREGDDGMVEGSPADAPPQAESDTPQKAAKTPTNVAEVIELFPDDLPQWDRATLMDAIGASEGTGVQTLAADASPNQAADFYRGELEGSGWALTEERTVDDFTMLEFQRDGEVLTVTIEPNEEGGSEVNLVNR